MKFTSIRASVEAYYAEQPVSLHVPGHKNGRGLELPYSNLDVTEIPGTDNLHHPEEAILMTQKRASEIYSSKATYFLINGTTCGNQAMLLSAARPGESVLIARNAHKSVHTACIIGGLEPVYVQPAVHADYGIPMGVRPEDIEVSLKANPSIKAVMITSPTYEGIHSDIAGIATVVHAHGAVLLVDEAHGAHVALSGAFGKSALQCGADAAVQSTHKSMNALTQASMLHVGTDRINQNRLEKWLSMLQSSSPSYPLLMSLESTLDYMGDQGRAMAETLVDNLKEVHEALAQMNIPVLGALGKVDQDFLHDISKLVIFVEDAEAVEEALRKEYGIQIEYATADSLVCVTSIWNTKEDFTRLVEGLRALDVKAPEKSCGLTNYPEIEVILTPAQAFDRKTCRIPLSESAGRICAEYVIPYPPGIPMCSPGELLTEEIVSGIRRWAEHGHAVIGTSDKTLKTIEVIDNRESEE